MASDFILSQYRPGLDYSTNLNLDLKEWDVEDGFEEAT